MEIKRGISTSMMKQFAAKAKDGALSAKDVRTVLSKGIAALKHDFAGADSEKGLAAQRKAIATTYRAAASDWTVGPAAQRAAKGILGAELDGKGGALAKVEESLRNKIHSVTIGGY